MRCMKLARKKFTLTIFLSYSFTMLLLSRNFHCFVICLQYIIIITQKLESEAPAIVESSRPEDSWPREGSIKFSEVDMRYREGLPLVLKSVNLDIKAQEKIGIVGRTGSGE